MKFDKIAELAGDIVISRENMERVLHNCKKEYSSHKDKKSKSFAGFVVKMANQQNQ